MKRLFLSALFALLGAMLLAGCGNGSKSARAAHGIGSATLRVSIPPAVASKLAAALAAHRAGAAGHSSRVIPNPVGGAALTLQFDTVNGAGSITPYTSQAISLTAGATSKVQNIPDTNITPNVPALAAGAANTILVTVSDANGAALASGSATVNVAPGSTAADNQINITLQSVVTAPITFVLDGVPVPAAATPVIVGTGNHTLAAVLRNAPDNTSITTIQAANLNWTASNANATLNTAQGYSITFHQAAAGASAIRVSYSESLAATNGQANTQNINSAALNVVFRNLSAGTTVGIASDTPPPANVPYTPGALPYDMAGNGYVLLYDATRTTGLDANAGYSRILQYANPPTSTRTQFLDFDTATAPTYTGSGSRMAVFSIAAAPFWAVVKGDGTQLQALPNTPTQARAPTPRWTYTPAGGAAIVDVDARGTTVYALENAAGAYRVSVLDATGTGTISASSAITLSALGFAPLNLAVAQVLDAGGALAETDVYVSNASNIRQVKSGGALTPTFGSAGLINTIPNLVDIAVTDDPRFVYALTTTGISVLDLDGSAAGAQATANTGLHLAASGLSLFALENNSGLQLEGFQIQ